MLPMARLALRGIDRLLRCLRPIHVAPSSSGGCMETPAQDPTARWAMLYGRGRIRDPVGASEAYNAAADPRTSNGRRHLRVFLDLAVPPASSFLRFDWEPGDKRLYYKEITVVATHDDSALIHVDIGPNLHYRHSLMSAYFVYRLGAPRPPALTLLPDHGWLYEEDTGLLRRGDGDLLVVVLDLRYETTGPRHTAELLVHRVGTSEWERKRLVPIVLDKGTEPEDLKQWCTPDAVVPVGDRFLCWVNYRYGFLLCNMAEASAKLRYVPLPPPEELDCSYYCINNDMNISRNMCAAGADTLRLVTLDKLPCRPLQYGDTAPFTLTTWTLSRLSTDMAEPMSWAKDGVLDCEELWALPGYEDIPHLRPTRPVVSPDNPDVVCFMVRGRSSNHPEWTVEVDTRRKMVLNVVESNVDDGLTECRHLPVKLYS